MQSHDNGSRRLEIPAAASHHVALAVAEAAARRRAPHRWQFHLHRILERAHLWREHRRPLAPS